MRILSTEDTARGYRLRIALIVAISVGLLWAASTPLAQAKGPVRLTFCGERACVAKSSHRFAAAMLYGGRLHVAPVCSTRVHVVTIVFPPNPERRRYLLHARRGLIGERGRRGHIWWRQVKGSRKADLVRAVRNTGRGFKANAELRIGMLRFIKAPARRWRLRDGVARPGHLTCGLEAARG